MENALSLHLKVWFMFIWTLYERILLFSMYWYKKERKKLRATFKRKVALKTPKLTLGGTFYQDAFNA